MESAANFSVCRTWRYTLRRTWDRTKPPLIVVGLNPSTADEDSDDPTIRKCVKFGKSWGYGGLLMLNAYAFKATNPTDLWLVKYPVGPDNDEWLIRAPFMYPESIVLAAWGTNIKPEREAEVVELLPPDRLKCLEITKNGHPKHPLYVKDITQPIDFSL